MLKETYYNQFKGWGTEIPEEAHKVDLYFFIRTRLKHYLNNMSKFQNIHIETFYVFYN